MYGWHQLVNAELSRPLKSDLAQGEVVYVSRAKFIFILVKGKHAVPMNLVHGFMLPQISYGNASPNASVGVLGCGKTIQVNYQTNQDIVIYI